MNYWQESETLSGVAQSRFWCESICDHQQKNQAQRGPLKKQSFCLRVLHRPEIELSKFLSDS